MSVLVDRGIVYGPSGKALDVYRGDAGRSPLATVLLWHGRGPDERDVLEPLARVVAERGTVVFVPDWCSDAPDGGRCHLLESIAFVRERAGVFGGDPDRVLLAGWSMGGKAAAGIGVTAGWRPAGVVAIASGFDRPAPSTGTTPLDEIATTAAEPVPFWLVHGVMDPIVDVARSRDFAAALRRRGWPVTLLETDTDHAGVVMTEYDPSRGRCSATRAPLVAEAGLLSARVLAEAAATAGRPPPS